MEVRLPPLRERSEDVPLLVRHFLDEIARREKRRDGYQLSSRTLEKLARQAWPGNVRELRNFVERIVTLAEGRLIDDEAAGLEPPPAPPSAAPPTRYRHPHPTGIA